MIAFATSPATGTSPITKVHPKRMPQRENPLSRQCARFFTERRIAASLAERPGGNSRYNLMVKMGLRNKNFGTVYLSSLLLPIFIYVKLVKWVFRCVFLEVLCEKFFACCLNKG
jgi:hypothetical protein